MLQNIDLVEFGVNSISKRHNVLCVQVGVIPKGAESEKKYEITLDDFRAAAVLMCSYKDCCKPGCEICCIVMKVLSKDNVMAFILSRKFQNGALLVETAMRNNFKGWGNFSNKALGIPSNVCFPHGTGMMPYF